LRADHDGVVETGVGKQIVLGYPQSHIHLECGVFLKGGNTCFGDGIGYENAFFGHGMVRFDVEKRGKETIADPAGRIKPK
jgi:hypothetical protein